MARNPDLLTEDMITALHLIAAHGVRPHLIDTPHQAFIALVSRELVIGRADPVAIGDVCQLTAAGWREYRHHHLLLAPIVRAQSEAYAYRDHFFRTQKDNVT